MLVGHHQVFSGAPAADKHHCCGRVEDELKPAGGAGTCHLSFQQWFKMRKSSQPRRKTKSSGRFGGAAGTTSMSTTKNRQRKTTCRNTATEFKGMLGALRLWPFRSPRHATAAAPAAPMAASDTTTAMTAIAQAEEENFTKTDGDQTAIERVWRPRTALDVSRRSFAKAVQAEIVRAKYRQQQQQPAVFEFADPNAASLATLASQRQQGKPLILYLPKECGLLPPNGNIASSSSNNKDHAEAKAPWWTQNGGGRHVSVDNESSLLSLRTLSSASTLPPSPVAAAAAAAAAVANFDGAIPAAPIQQLPPLVPKTMHRSRKSQRRL